MDKRVIKGILSRKHKELCASIKDEEVRKLVMKNSIVTGGVIVSMLINEEVNDFDYYFTDFKTVEAVAKYYVNEFNRLHPDKSNGKTTKAYLKIEGDRVKIEIKSAGIIGENTDESQYEYFEGRPIEEGEEYVSQAIGETLTEADEIDGSILEDEKKEKYRPVFLTDNAITLSDKIQIVIRFHGDADKIHENYDGRLFA